MWALHQLSHRAVSSRHASGAVTDVDSIRGGGDHQNWDRPFSQEELSKFPALRRRNFWCIQRHQATALHYDLRLHVDEGLVSWAVPKGMMGIERGESRLAVETTIHPVSYAVYEGSETAGRGTQLWDIGLYSLEHETDPDSQTSDSESSDDILQEERLRLRLKQIRDGDKKSLYIVLHGGSKIHHQALVLIRPKASATYSRDGTAKQQWLLRLADKNASSPWGQGGEDGEQYGRSILSAFRSAPPADWQLDAHLPKFVAQVETSRDL